MLAIRRLFSSGSQTSNVGAGKCLGNGKANLLLAAKDLVGNLLLPGFIVGKVENGSETNGHAGHVAVLETTLVGTGHFLAENQVVEVVKLFTLDGTTGEGHTVQVLTRSQAHVQDALAAHVVNHLLADIVARLLALDGFGGQVLVCEDADGLLQPAMRVFVVGALELRREPERLGIGDGAQVARLWGDDLRLLVLNGANGEIGVLDQHFLTVEVVERCGRILAGDLL